MAQKTEQLPKETLDKLVSYQNQANELILNLGQIHLIIRELQLEIKRLESHSKRNFSVRAIHLFL